MRTTFIALLFTVLLVGCELDQSPMIQVITYKYPGVLTITNMDDHTVFFKDTLNASEILVPVDLGRYGVGYQYSETTLFIIVGVVDNSNWTTVTFFKPI